MPLLSCCNYTNIKNNLPYVCIIGEIRVFTSNVITCLFYTRHVYASNHDTFNLFDFTVSKVNVFQKKIKKEHRLFFIVDKFLSNASHAGNRASPRYPRRPCAYSHFRRNYGISGAINYAHWGFASPTSISHASLVRCHDLDLGSLLDSISSRYY